MNLFFGKKVIQKEKHILIQTKHSYSIKFLPAIRVNVCVH